MNDTQIWLTAARNAIDELLANDAANRLPELIALTDIPAKARELYDAIDDVLSVQTSGTRNETSPRHP